MSIPSNSKKRMAAAVAMLSVGGAGLTAGLGGGGVDHVTAAKPANRPSEVTAAWLPDATNDARVGLVARRVGWSRYALERARSGLSGALEAPGELVVDEDVGGKSPPERARHTITVALPSYEGGRLPSMTGPTFDAGERPTVDPGWTTTVHLGELPSVGAPSVDSGEFGTLHPPTVDVS